MLTHANEHGLNVKKVTIVTAEHTIEKVFIISIIFFPFCFLMLFFFSSCSDKHSSSRDFHHYLTPYLGSSTAPRQVQDIFTVFNQMDNILRSYTQYLEQASIIPVICSQYIFPFPSLFLPICLLPLWNPWPVEITGPATSLAGRIPWFNREKQTVCQGFFGLPGNSLPRSKQGKTTCNMSAIPGYGWGYLAGSFTWLPQ